MSTNDLHENTTAVLLAVSARDIGRGPSMLSNITFAGSMLLGLASAGIVHAQAPVANAANSDVHLSLKEIPGDRPMAELKRHNVVSATETQRKVDFPSMQTRFKTILNSEERIPHVSKVGGYYYHFLRDTQHVRGIWRRTTVEQDRGEGTVWETVIDLDKLAISENEGWIWGGATCLYPQGERCLISLSRGSDANVVREYDMATRAFVDEGVTIPETKGTARWIDQNTLFISIDHGPESMTNSGHPRIIKVWRRGTPLAQAKNLYEAKPDDMAAGAFNDFTPGYEREFIVRQIDYCHNEMFLRNGDGLKKLPKPDDATAFIMHDQLLIMLHSDWTINNKIYPQGALVAANFASFMRGKGDLEVLFFAAPRSLLLDADAAKCSVPWAPLGIL